MTTAPSTPPELRGRFEAPLIGHSKAPAGVVGEGCLRLLDDGLQIGAEREARGLMNGLGCLGAVTGFVSLVLIGIALGNAGVDKNVALYAGVPVFLGLLFGGFALGRMLGRAKPWEGKIAWSSVRAPSVEGDAVVFELKAKPKGWVWFRPAGGSAVEVVKLLATRAKT
jgi:hypothetical protein